MQPDRTLDYYMKRLFTQLDMGEFASEYEVRQVYRLLVGDTIFGLTTLCNYRSGTLSLRYAAAALKHEMTIRRGGLMQRINEQLGGQVIKKIVIL